MQTVDPMTNRGHSVFVSLAVLVVTSVVAGCGQGSGGSGTGGRGGTTSSTGGTSSSGGTTTSTGGATSSAGATGAGGTTGSAGTIVSTGGTTGSAGTKGSAGGTTSSGGTTAASTGGTTSSAGATGTGGTTNTGGMTGSTGGTISSGGTTAAGTTLKFTTTNCPAATQGQAYSCTLAASGGTSSYAFSVTNSSSYAQLPEGMSLNSSTGVVSSALVGGQGTYGVQFQVADSANHVVTAAITFSVAGNNAFLASIFPPNSIFHHRVDAASTALPVDTSPAAPIYSGYQASHIRVFFGNAAYLNLPNGIPASRAIYSTEQVHRGHVAKDVW